MTDGLAIGSCPWRRNTGTDMVKDFDSPKSRPEDIAQAVLAGIEAGESEVLADDTARYVKAGFGHTPPLYLGG